MRLITERLILRSLTLRDAAVLQRLLNDPQISGGLLSVGYPFTLDEAKKWLAKRMKGRFAIALRESGELCGAIGIHSDPEHPRAEIGYWIGRAYWGNGYATEAASRLIQYGFEKLKLQRIAAMCFPRNTASQRVLEKIGMQREGLLRHYAMKGGSLENLMVYSILKQEAEPAGPAL